MRHIYLLYCLKYSKNNLFSIEISKLRERSRWDINAKTNILMTLFQFKILKRRYINKNSILDKQKIFQQNISNIVCKNCKILKKKR